jgi:hypothetical protein
VALVSLISQSSQQKFPWQATMEYSPKNKFSLDSLGPSLLLEQ